MTDIEVPIATSVSEPGVVMSMPVEIDVATAPEIRTQGLTALESFDLGPLFLDMAPVKFIDAAGLGALVDLDPFSRGCHREIVLLNVSPHVRRVLAKGGLAGAFRETNRLP